MKIMRQHKVLIFVCLLLAAVLFTGCGKRAVPDLVGKPSEMAEWMLTQLDLHMVQTSEHSTTVEAGTVMAQDPAAGMELKKDETVHVTVSAGPRMLTVPSVLLQSAEDAARQLQDAGFVAESVEAFSDEVEKGLVIEQSVSAGEVLAEETKILLTVSKGQDLVPVPEFAGISLPEARKQLEDHGFRWETLRAYSDTVEKDCVISCEPGAGERVKRGSVITITVSDGVEMLAVPNLTGLDREKAENAVKNVGFVPAVAWEYSDTVAREALLAQQPAAYTMIPKGSSVTITVSAGIEQVQVPNVAGMTRDEARSALSAAKLGMETSMDYSTTVPSDKAMSQSVEAGKTVDKDSVVHVVFSRGPRYVRVPDVTRMTEQGARSVLAAGLLQVKVEYATSMTYSKGTVMKQSLAAESRVVEGTVVELVVCSGKEQVSVPNVVNMTYSQAVSALKAQGLHTERVAVRVANYGNDVVTRQDLAAGTVVDMGTTVMVFVNEVPVMIAMPNVVGMSRQQAVSALNGAGFKAQIQLRCSDTVKDGLVISQSIQAGVQTEKDTAVTAYISAGPANTVGNTNTNALNYGVVAAQGDWVYFSNFNYNFYIYKMRPDGSEKQIVLAEQADSLCVVGDWIYFNSLKLTGGIYDGVCKVRIDGTQRTQLRRGYYSWIYVEGDWIYFMESRNGSKIYRMKTDGTGYTTLCADQCAEPVVLADRIVYRLKEGGNLYSMNKDGTDKKVLVQNMHSGEIYHMTETNGYIYAMRNFNILRIDPATGKYITYNAKMNEQISYLAAHDGWLYYLKYDFTSEPFRVSLCRMRADFTGEMELVGLLKKPGTNFYLAVAGDWLYFPDPADNRYLYRVRVDGTEVQKVYN